MIERCCLLACLTTLMATAASAPAQDGQGMVLRTLDETVSLSIPDMPVNLAIKRLSGAVGLAVRLDERALEMLPYGEETRLAVEAPQIRLADVLSGMLRPMCLTWSVEGDGIVIRPNALLARLGRRPTYAETTALAALAAEEIRPGDDVAARLREIAAMPALEIAWAALDATARQRAEQAGLRMLPATAADYLDAMCDNRGLTWLLCGQRIVIVSEAEQVRRLLGRVVSVNFRQQPLADVVQQLLHQAGLGMKMDPGALAALPDELREGLTLVLSRSTVGEALETLSGVTGLVFEPDGLAVRVRRGSAQPAAAAGPKRPDFVLVASVSDDAGQHYQLFIRPDDLPDEVAQQLEAQKQLLLKRLGARPAPAEMPGNPKKNEEDVQE